MIDPRLKPLLDLLARELAAEVIAECEAQQSQPLNHQHMAVPAKEKAGRTANADPA